MDIKLHLDTSGVERAINDLRRLVPKSRVELCERAAKGFVATAIEITPPASKGKTGSKAKAQGEQAIKSDIGKIMMGVRKKRDLDTRGNAASPQELYERFRDKRTGRINPRALAHPYKVRSSELQALVAKILANVGWTAAGWNRAAEKLGLSGRQWPEWIRRHGGGRGDIHMDTSQGRFRITVENKVPYLTNIKDLDRRCQAAIDYQENAMRREAEFHLQKMLKAAGWK